MQSFVLIDFENVQPADLAALEAPHFRVILFAGASQASVPFELAQALQAMGERGQYLKVSGNGRNALDFHIAFYIGRLAAAHPKASFHIVSRDKGFDPLIQHLATLGIVASRVTELAAIARPGAAGSGEERLARVLANLQSLNGGRPRTVKTLSNTIASVFQKQLAESEVAAILRALQDKGHVVVNGTKVTYALP
ncbi:MAG TPA: PIN domain-containing protein [Burkholderiales bacterium]